MSIRTPIADSASASKVMPWRLFLESEPPGQQRTVSGVVEELQDRSIRIVTPSIKLYCDFKDCAGERFFDAAPLPATYFRSKEWSLRFINYRCRHCQQKTKTFALSVLVDLDEAPNGEALKIGEWPPFGPHIPTKMFSLLGDDQAIFHKGRRAESQGMGIGAFAYYRRVVENQKNRLIDEIIKVSELLKAPSGLIANLKAAREEIQFKKSIEIIKDGIPEVLRLSGHNPLTLLHSALSDGLHGESDEECLARATVIRTVMAELSERFVEVLKDQAELNQAVSKLLQIQTTLKSKPQGVKATQQTSSPDQASTSASSSDQEH